MEGRGDYGVSGGWCCFHGCVEGRKEVGLMGRVEGKVAKSCEQARHRAADSSAAGETPFPHTL